MRVVARELSSPSPSRMTLTLSAPLSQHAAPIRREAVEALSRQRGEPDWLSELRREALEAYEQLPLEEVATGNWRRSSFKGLSLESISAAGQSRGPLPPSPELDLAGRVLQVAGQRVDAMLCAEASAPGVRLLDLAEAVREGSGVDKLVHEHLGRSVPFSVDKLTALHYALLNGGVVLYVPRGVTVAQPIYVQHHFPDPGQAAFVHTLVIAEESSDVTLVEAFSSTGHEDGSPLVSGVVELVVGQNAQVRYVQVQEWSRDRWVFSHQRASLGRDAAARLLTVALGGHHVRNTIQTSLEGQGSQADLLGVVAGSGRQHVDFQTLQDHLGSHTRSDLVIHNALRDRSSSNFTGLIRINKEARGTESSQEQKNVLLSDFAKADSDPKLEILNNDVVRCTHGASVGPIDTEQIYYLQTRGLHYDDAQDLLLEGFFRSVVEKLDKPAVQELAWEAIRRQVTGLEEDRAAA